MKKNILNLCVIGISILMLFTLILKTQSIDVFFEQIVTLSPLWIILALVFMFLYWGLEALTLHTISNFEKTNNTVKESFSVTMVGQFFNSITPFATGGQPAQVLYLMKNGVETGNASFIVMMKFFVFQSVLTVYSFVVIFLSFNSFQPRIPLLLTMTVLGLAVHASMIVVTILFTYNRTLTQKFLLMIFRFLKRIRIVKAAETAEKTLEQSLANFHDYAVLLKHNMKLLFKTFGMVFLQLTFFFAIPFCIIQSFGVTDFNYLEAFAAAVFVATVISIVPLPGATGGAEGGFFLFFSPFFTSSAIVPAILIWRIITYYSCIGFGGLFAVVIPKREKKVLE